MDEKLDELPNIDILEYTPRDPLEANLHNAIFFNDIDLFLSKFNEMDIAEKIKIIKHVVLFDKCQIFRIAVESVGPDLTFDNNVLLKLASVYSVDILQYLLQNGVRADAENNFAIKIGINRNPQIVKLLLENGADACADNNLPICKAASISKTDNDLVNISVSILVNYGADIHARNEYPLRVASKNNSFWLIKYLLENGANVRTHNDYPLRTISRYGFEEHVKVLLEHGANVSALTKDDLLHIIMNAHFEVIKLLLDSGADFTIINSIDHRDIAYSENAYNIITTLINNGIDAKLIALILTNITGAGW